MGLALWLASPDESTNAVLREEIERLSPRSGKDQPRNVFPPHVTVVSSLDSGADVETTWNTALRCVRTCTADLKSDFELRIALRRLDTQGRFFQCVYLLLETTLTLQHLNQLVRTAMQQENAQTGYMPHLSLLYADLSVEQALNVVDGLYADGTAEKQPFAFRGLSQVNLDILQLWDCTGPVQGWKKLREVSIRDLY